MSQAILRPRNRLLLASSTLLMLFTWFFLSGSAQAAPAYSYPDDGNSSHYLSVSKAGGTISLEAPFSFLKARFTASTQYYDIEVTDGCYWMNVDGGSSRPVTCEAGQMTFFFCPSDANGQFDSSYKSSGQCYQTDPDTWPNGQGTQLNRFKVNGAAGTAWPLNMPDVGGQRYIYVVAEMKVIGLNGFKVRSVARSSSGAETGDSRIGLGGQLAYPLSLVSLPLTPGGSDEFSVSFQVPCAPVRASFQMGWYDADRPPNGSPLDTDINWRLRNQTSDQELNSGQFAFMASMNEDAYLRGNNENRVITVNDINLAGFAMRVREGDRYTLTWQNVNLNNGIQIQIPFDEADSGTVCGPPTVDPPVSGPPTCSPASQNVEINTPAFLTAGGGNGVFSWSAPGGSIATGSGNSFNTIYNSLGPKIVTVTSNSQSVTCSVTVIVTNRPYLRVYGGDVQVGTSLVSGCPAIAPNNAKILTFNLGSSGWQGAGTQMAAFALGNINGFTSSNAGSSSGSGKRLSLSNTAGDSTYGGAFGKTTCAPDYWAGATSPVASYNVPAAGYTVNIGTETTIYVNGNAIIEGNIIYAGSTTWANLDVIPSYTLVVRGNIYIGRNVTQLDGTYIALPNGASGGTIYTCTNGSSPYGSGGSYAASDCNTTLTVNGSFIAEDIRFTRTRGTLNSADIAEIFRYGPEVWVK